MSKFALRTTIMLLFAVAVVGATRFNQAKVSALAFHTRDFPFYMQYAAKMLDPSLSDQYALNPSGYNMLGFSGVEGTRGLHQTIHFEPVKMVYALLHTGLPSPLTILAFIAVIYFSPLLYLLHITPLQSVAERRWLLLVALFYVTCPLTLSVLAHDARPFALLPPLFMLAILAVHRRRPFWEIALFCNLLFVVREEGLLLSATVIVYYIMCETRSRARLSASLILIAMWLGWLGIILSYFIWAGYPVSTSFNPLTSLLRGVNQTIVVGLLGLGGVVAVLFTWLKRYGRTPLTAWSIMAYCTIFGTLGWQFVRHQGDKFRSMSLPDAASSMLADFVASPRFALHVVAILLLAILLWDGVPRMRFRRGLAAGASASIALFVAIHSQSTVDTIRAYSAQRAHTAPVFDLRHEIDPTQTHLLVDYATYQAFYDHENVYVYNRLPWYLVPSDDRYHPANLPVLQTLVSTQVAWIVIAKESTTSIQEVLSLAQVTPIDVVENEHYTLMKLR